tara:strand:+ start:72 stop:248 length:177 start_codon:yes stop_codon:yes gene_type:complete
MVLNISFFKRTAFDNHGTQGLNCVDFFSLQNAFFRIFLKSGYKKSRKLCGFKILGFDF